MKKMLCAFVALLASLCAGAQAPSESRAVTEASPGAEASHVPGGVPLTDLILAVSKSTGKKFLLDPRVRGEAILLGRSPSSLSYSDLLTVLRIHGFAAVEGSSGVEVLPDAFARTMATPLITEKETRPESEIVTATIHVKNSPAAQLVPILRPLLPQYAHIAADICSNILIVVDTYSNVKRVEAIVQRLDVGEPFKPQTCEARVSAPRDTPAK